MLNEHSELMARAIRAAARRALRWTGHGRRWISLFCVILVTLPLVSGGLGAQYRAARSRPIRSPLASRSASVRQRTSACRGTRFSTRRWTFRRPWSGSAPIGRGAGSGTCSGRTSSGRSSRIRTGYAYPAYEWGWDELRPSPTTPTRPARLGHGLEGDRLKRSEQLTQGASGPGPPTPWTASLESSNFWTNASARYSAASRSSGSGQQCPRSCRPRLQGVRREGRVNGPNERRSAGTRDCRPPLLHGD